MSNLVFEVEKSGRGEFQRFMVIRYAREGANRSNGYVVAEFHTFRVAQMVASSLKQAVETDQVIRDLVVERDSHADS